MSAERVSGFRVLPPSHRRDALPEAERPGGCVDLPSHRQGAVRGRSSGGGGGALPAGLELALCLRRRWREPGLRDVRAAGNGSGGGGGWRGARACRRVTSTQRGFVRRTLMTPAAVDTGRDDTPPAEVQRTLSVCEGERVEQDEGGDGETSRGLGACRGRAGG